MFLYNIISNYRGTVNIELHPRGGTGQDFLGPTVKFQNLRRLTVTGRPVFLQKVFVHCSMYLMKNFQNGGAWRGVKICDFGRGLRKKTLKKFCVFCKNDSILRPFQIKFRFKRPVLSCAKPAQNKHKKNWRAQAKLLVVLSNDLKRKARRRS